ncbi:GntR family transcriptional regulator [Rosenbergiella australiborealis]|uniref:GntR family transcriptional regulator n=1 Tax=Rosenbergiella australiborealis TaxID=1544696 RepID=UPI001F4E18C5|nr:GntR family transcriptional regulator [Rosenbergiella australiborealis]
MSHPSNTQRREALADKVYYAVKQDIFDFRLLPGDRFSENELAERLNVSRTPVRQALFRLAREGYAEVIFRSGWQVKAFDFDYFEELYDLRILLECEAVKRLCALSPSRSSHALAAEKAFWIEAPVLSTGQQVALQDEAFHHALVAATENKQFTLLHRELTEKISIIRRLDFTRDDRITATYQQHRAILHAIFHQQSEQALSLLTDHITESKAAVRNITLHRLQQARRTAQVPATD